MVDPWLTAEHRPGETNLDHVLYMLREVLSRYERLPVVTLIHWNGREVTLVVR